MSGIYEKLEKYTQEGFYGFHMPGHKRNVNITNMGNAVRFDITEIEGFDNLHNANGILHEAMCRAAKVYGSDESFFLVNGSTGGLLAAISSVAGQGDKVIFARNNHKASYNALHLRGIEPVYIMPEFIPEFGINGGIIPASVEKAIRKNPDVKAVIIVSPTYEGVVSDIARISEICHENGIILIVDAAHGAHFVAHEIFPKEALLCGADIVIESLHKTLPALTQSAILHVKGKRADRNRIRQFLSIYQTSSPSYVLMASMDESIGFVKKKELFDEYVERLSDLRLNIRKLKNIEIPGKELIGKYGVFDYDISKLFIVVKKAGYTGLDLYNELLEKNSLQLEMPLITGALAMTSAGDTKEGFERLLTALTEIDLSKAEVQKTDNQGDFEEIILPEKRINIKEACEAQKRDIALIESTGKICGEYVNLYPPGIPIVVPGEILNENIIKKILHYKNKGFEISGLTDGEYIKFIEG